MAKRLSQLDVAIKDLDDKIAVLQQAREALVQLRPAPTIRAERAAEK